MISLTPDTQERASPTFKSPKSIRFMGFSPSSKGERVINSTSSSPKANRSPKMVKIVNQVTIFSKSAKQTPFKSAGLPPQKPKHLIHRRSSEMLAFGSKKDKNGDNEEHKKRVARKDFSKYKELLEIKDVFERSEMFHAECKKLVKNVKNNFFFFFF